MDKQVDEREHLEVSRCVEKRKSKLVITFIRSTCFPLFSMKKKWVNDGSSTGGSINVF